MKAAAQDVVAQQAVFFGLRDGFLKPVNRQRVLGANVDDPVRGAHQKAADDHSFEQRMRIALDLIAVHVGAGVALIRVADNELPPGPGLAQELPLQAGQVTGAAAAAQLGGLDLAR